MCHLNTPNNFEDTNNVSLIYEKSNNKIADTLLLRDVEKIFLAGNTQINSKADLPKIVEKPCLAVCEQLYDKNILTYWSSANKESPYKAEVIIRYESLDEKYKKIANDLSARGILSIGSYLDSRNTAEEYGQAVILRIKTNPNMTVKEISEQLCSVAMNFAPQDIKYNVYTPDYLSQYAFSYNKPKTIFGFPSLERIILGDEYKNQYSLESNKLYNDIRYFIYSIS